MPEVAGVWRAGMETDEMVARFAGLNNIGLVDAAAQFENVDAQDPRLLFEAVGNSMAEEAVKANPETPMSYSNEVLFKRWCQSHSVVGHKGDTWSTGWSDLSGQPLFRYLVTILRIRDKRALAKFYRAWDLAEAQLDRTNRSPRWFGTYCDHPRAFASQEHPRILAGINMAPYSVWDWDELEAFSSFLRDAGLGVRIGMTEDQWYNGGTTPIVIWNPALVDVPVVGNLGGEAV